jgi:hypothetical protein
LKIEYDYMNKGKFNSDRGTRERCTANEFPFIKHLISDKYVIRQ